MPFNTTKGTRATAIILFAAVMLHPALAWAHCDDDTIDVVSPNGDLVILYSGETYNVDSGDEVTAAGWMENEDVLVCGDVMINRDESGERVGISPH
ncbi:hypothetical protein [Aestuariivirga sp.]|uniref:hypothetical protein n=1 Tax=Aestuariivirga sp. TaxID=2650926 RepID=UPI0039E3E012